MSVRLVRGVPDDGAAGAAPSGPDRPSPALSIETSGRGPHRTLKLEGELDLGSTGDFFAAAAPLVGDAAVAEIGLDLSELSFLDSSGLHLLLRLRTLCEENGVALVLRSASEQVTQLLDVTGVTVSVDAAE
jgi:anti-anti-sigma factor